MNVNLQSSSYTELQFCVNCHNSINNENTNNDIDNNETDINKNCSIKGNVNNNNLKLNKKKVKEIKQVNDPESGLFLYIDLHGHASKKGIFMYGNHFEDIEKSVDCMLLPRIMSLNNCHFHFTSCNFTERNMYLR